MSFDHPEVHRIKENVTKYSISSFGWNLFRLKLKVITKSGKEISGQMWSKGPSKQKRLRVCCKSSEHRDFIQKLFPLNNNVCIYLTLYKHEISHLKKSVEDLYIWLIVNKQVQKNWSIYISCEICNEKKMQIEEEENSKKSVGVQCTLYMYPISFNGPGV